MEQTPNPTIVLTPAQTEHQSKANTALILGIVGLVLALVPVLVLPGLVVSIVGLVTSVKNRKLAAENAFVESGSNKGGFVCSLIGVILGGLHILAVVMLLALGLTIVSAVVSSPAGAAAISESIPALSDAIEGVAPGALSAIVPLLPLL